MFESGSNLEEDEGNKKKYSKGDLIQKNDNIPSILFFKA